jgi:two-component system, NtrC family, response regulator HydG
LPLDPASQTRIGRGAECTVMLADALCSRVHAVISHEDHAWWVRDAQSRNGTFVNGQKIDEAALGDGHRLRVGGTEFLFRQSNQPPTAGPVADLSLTQTIIKDTRVGAEGVGGFATVADGESEHTRELRLLYQLSLALLGCADTRELMRLSLEMLREHTGASVAGFLWASDDGQLKPKLLVPEQAAAQVTLSE